MQLPERAGDLIDFGWEIAELSLARAESELRLVTHWFLTPGDDSVNADDHFGSDERTLRFLGVALPTLIEQLGATAAVVVLPWGLEEAAPTLTVIGVGFGEPAVVETRALVRLADEGAAAAEAADGVQGAGSRGTAGAGPPFWRLEPDRLAPPEHLAAVASGLAIKAPERG